MGFIHLFIFQTCFMVTDIDLIKEFAAEWGFKFNVTRTVEDFNNLLDDDFVGFYLFVAENQMTPQKQGEFGFDEVYTGKIFVVTPSDIDGVLIDHEGNYDKYLNVKNVHSMRPWNLLNAFNCPSEVKTQYSNVKSVYNWQNINYDGVVFDYTITFENKTTQLTKQEILNLIQNGR